MNDMEKSVESAVVLELILKKYFQAMEGDTRASVLQGVISAGLYNARELSPQDKEIIADTIRKTYDARDNYNLIFPAIINIAHARGLSDEDIKTYLPEIARAKEQFLKEEEEQRIREARAEEKDKLELSISNTIDMAKEQDPNASIIDAIKPYISRIQVLDTTNDSGYNRSAKIDTILKRDPPEGFISNTLMNVLFPQNALSLIGARTGRGKTTALVSLGVEALIKGIPVTFATLEESQDSILRRFLMCYAYSISAPNERTALMQENPRKDKDISRGPGYAYYLWRKFKNKAKVSSTFLQAINNAYEAIKAYEEKNLFSIYDADGASYNELFSRLIRTERNGLILFDYVQKMPTPKGAITRLEIIKQGNWELVTTAKALNAIVIGGAQFNRGGVESLTDKNGYDHLRLSNFRDSGDLEQDANVVIGLGGNDTTISYCKERWCEIMKSRESDIGTSRYLDFVGAYSYLASNNTQFIRPSKNGGRRTLPKDEDDSTPLDYINAL